MGMRTCGLLVSPRAGGQGCGCWMPHGDRAVLRGGGSTAAWRADAFCRLFGLRQQSRPAVKHKQRVLRPRCGSVGSALV